MRFSIRTVWMHSAKPGVSPQTSSTDAQKFERTALGASAASLANLMLDGGGSYKQHCHAMARGSSICGEFLNFPFFCEPVRGRQLGVNVKIQQDSQLGVPKLFCL
jgi:hypothetical protein